MIHRTTHPQAQVLLSTWLYKLSGVAALTAACILVAGALELTFSAFRPDIRSEGLALLQNNWLVVLFKLHAGFPDVQSSLLYRMDVLDLVILAFTAILYVGLYIALRNTSRVWSLIALAQPALGIVLFIVTSSVGRSAVMGAELVISGVMLRSKFFSTPIAYIGMLSALLLLAGDLGASLAPSSILAIATGTGYILLVIWFVLISKRLLQTGRNNEME